MTMIRIHAASRLHFGLLNPAGAETWLTAEGGSLPARRFGGVGLMVEEPGLVLEVERAQDWSAEGPHAARALAVASALALRRARAGLPLKQAMALPAARLRVVAAPPEHVGLGTGTQLALCVARGLAELWGMGTATAILAVAVGRGQRSALGVHGFEHGGFLVEGGKLPNEALGTLLFHHRFPDDWRLLLARPAVPAGLHGPPEERVFQDLAHEPGTLAQTETLCRLVLLGMLPALLSRDLHGFGEALHDFNRRVGEVFAASQGGPYAGPAVAALVKWLRGQGVRGVGQSSWGPTVFAVVLPDEAEPLRSRLLASFAGTEVIVTGACNRPARVGLPPSAG
jgi:beta-RFAP synthase